MHARVRAVTGRRGDASPDDDDDDDSSVVFLSSAFHALHLAPGTTTGTLHFSRANAAHRSSACSHKEVPLSLSPSPERGSVAQSHSNSSRASRVSSAACWRFESLREINAASDVLAAKAAHGFLMSPLSNELFISGTKSGG